ncbi:glycosyltransferase [Methylovirgula sp. 4M-Z18]|uniref:glycosyltransferase n=1 Tax=Methylovirgula sp. 4M-Z18 TaxID=2293567 RepID=UPI0030CDACA1
MRESSERLKYASAMRWLRRYDLFASNSKATAVDLMQLLRVDAAQIHVTGCPLPSPFENFASEAAPPQVQKHILVMGGGDPRKNPEVVIRAHATSRALQSGDGVPLVIGGGYDQHWAEKFRALAEHMGGRADLVVVPGPVDDTALISFYRNASVIICPSHDEGFSIPVIEAMAAGVPCLVSNIPAHLELVEDSALRFPPDDDQTLRAKLEHLRADQAASEATIAAQNTVWPKFSAAAVGERFWAPFMERIEARQVPVTPAVVGRRKPRVALLSPVQPDRSGVADYTASTCAEFGKFVELDVFSETANPVPVPNATRLLPLGRLPHLLPSYDRVIGVIGNSDFHVRIFDFLRDYGGAAIAHDARMLGFYATLKGRKAALRLASHELGRPVSEEELNLWLTDESQLKALFLSEMAESASPLIVHSPVTVREMQQRYSLAPVCLPFCAMRPLDGTQLCATERQAARRRLGIADGDVLIATFGFVHENKGADELVQALALLRASNIPARLHFVGDTVHLGDDGKGLRARVAELGLTPDVQFETGYVPENVYRDYLIGADLGVQLRKHGFGSVSAALLDAAIAGLPSVANVTLAEAIDVRLSYVRTISDTLSPQMIADALASLHACGTTRETIEPERENFMQSRSFATYARELCDALQLDRTPETAAN